MTSVTSLLWPGDDRAGEHFADRAVLEAMVRVEAAWLAALVDARVAPAGAADDLDRLVGRRDEPRVAQAAEASGNPVVPLLALLREQLRTRNAAAAHWLHRGLTSQDVLDTALVLCARDTVTALAPLLDRQVEALADLVRRHRDDLQAGRTLTQHAVPITFGLKAAQWLHGMLDARDGLRTLTLPAQVGGAAGTLSAVVELVASTGAAPAPVAGALDLADDLARRLGLVPALPWHTTRTPLTTYADALVRAHDAWGHLAGDVLVLARPEVAELAEPAVEGRGGSSTMPQKSNPVLSVLVRRAATTAPALAAQLHLAAAGAVDERPDGAWHTEWTALATLSRRTLTSASQVAELLEGLHVDTGAMASVVRQRSSALLAERRSIRSAVGSDAGAGADSDFDPAHYLGATGALIDRLLDRVSRSAGGQEVP